VVFLFLGDEDLRRHCLDLGHDILGDELGKVEDADIVDETKLEEIELKTGQVELVEDTETLELQKGLELLKLKDGLEIKGLCLEETLEGEDIKVVDGTKASEKLKIQRVDVEQIVQVDLVETVQVVELG